MISYVEMLTRYGAAFAAAMYMCVRAGSTAARIHVHSNTGVNQAENDSTCELVSPYESLHLAS